MADPELDALTAICKALNLLEDEKSKQRVMDYAYSRFGLQPASLGQKKTQGEGSRAEELGEKLDAKIHTEIPGIARLTDKGDLKFTIRDLKARSTNDAARRLAYIVIHVNEKLTGQKTLSSPKTLVPILREWRAYDPNTRKKMKEDKGIIRDGELLSLDAHAQKEAESMIREIQDDSIEGSWKPSPTTGRKTGGRGKKVDGDTKK